MGRSYSMYKWAKRKLGIKSQANIEAENQQTEPKTIPEEQPPKPKTLPDDVWKIILEVLLSEPNVTKDVLNAFLNLEIPEEVDIYYDLKINKKLKLLELKRMSVIQPLSILQTKYPYLVAVCEQRTFRIHERPKMGPCPIPLFLSENKQIARYKT